MSTNKISRTSLKRVVLISASRPNKRDYDRYGAAFFNSCGIDVIWLDVMDICHPHLKPPTTNEPLPNGVTTRHISTLSELNKEETTLRSADVVFALFTDSALTRHNLPVFKLIARAGTHYAFLINNIFPGVYQYKGEARNALKRISHIISRLRSLDFKSSLLFRLPFRWLGLRQANYAIHGGRKSAVSRNSIGAITKRIYAHAHDYEYYTNDKSDAESTTQTAVFVDQNIFQHHDFTLYPGFSLGNPNDYYHGLNAFFDQIEQEFKLNVIIAAHPRADYEKYDNPFSGRKIIKGKTQQLIRDCQLAMTFTSQAINYAVLYGKPMAILSTRDFYRHPCGKSYQDPMAASIGNPIVFLENSEQENLKSLMTVDSDLYDRFIENYIKIPESTDAPLWEIIIKEICHHQSLIKPAYKKTNIKHNQLEKNLL
jgi:hypothetical protein